MKSLILTGPEVRAFLNTKPNTWPAEPIDPTKPWKWQHRVPVRPQPTTIAEEVFFWCPPDDADSTRCAPAGVWCWCNRGIEYIAKSPLGNVGDLICIKETWTEKAGHKDGGRKQPQIKNHTDCYFKADWGGGLVDIGDDLSYAPPWRSPATMPPRASRLTLEVKAVGVERVQEIPHLDVLSEGVPEPELIWGHDFDIDGLLWPSGKKKYIEAFKEHWDPRWAKRGLGWEGNPWDFRYEMARVK